MRTAARLGWRVAAVVAFGATAALAVSLTRGAPLHAALTSARHFPQASGHDAGRAPPCAPAGLRISVGAGTSAASEPGRAGTGIPGLAVTRYPLDFTNVSGATCAVGGYPGVAAYRGDGAEVGNPAADTTPAAHRVVLVPGATAGTTVIASVPVTAAGCRPVAAAGLRVGPPGDPAASAARYVPQRLRACSAAGPGAPVFLSVRAVHLVTQGPAGPGAPHAA